MSDGMSEGEGDKSPPRDTLSRSTLLARKRANDPVEVDFGSLLSGAATGGAGELQLDKAGSGAWASVLRPSRRERRTEEIEGLTLAILRRGPFEFWFDEEDRLVNVWFGRYCFDHLPALTEQAMCQTGTDVPSQSDGSRPLWHGHVVRRFASLSNFASLLAPDYSIRLTAGRSSDRWLQFETDTSTAHLVADFILKVVRSEFDDSYHIDYGLCSLSAVSRRHRARFDDGASR